MDASSLRQILPLMPVFVSSARHLSFTKAAEELFVTQGAISQNIRKLETELGFALFHRFTRRIALTEEGELLLATLQNSLGEISDQIRSIRSQEIDGSLYVSSTPSFSSKWLAPRLKRFSQRYPGISIHVRGRNDLVDFETENVDVALYYGGGIHPELDVVFLMDEQLLPVCSKEFADTYFLWDKPELLQHCLLIHDSQPWPNAQYYSEWKFWFENVGITDAVFKFGCSFDLSETAATAASRGLGVAIGRRRLVQLDIDSGRLVAPIGKSITSEQAYYIVSMKEKASTPRVTAFRNWLLEEASLGGFQ